MRINICSKKLTNQFHYKLILIRRITFCRKIFFPKDERKQKTNPSIFLFLLSVLFIFFERANHQFCFHIILLIRLVRLFVLQQIKKKFHIFQSNNYVIKHLYHL